MAIFLPFLAALLIPLIYKRNLNIHIGWFVLIVPTILFITLTSYLPQITKGEFFTDILNWIPSFGINLTSYIDGLSLIFGLLITGIGALVVLYSIYYLNTEEDLGHFYTYLLLFMGSMLGVVFSDHMMILYAFWELTSISSFLLIAFWYQRKGSRYGAKKSLLITIFGGLGMLIGFLMLHEITGTFSIRETILLIAPLKDHILFTPALVLILLGAFTKSAQFPFHIWLPDAMEAPTPVSAYLHSATMVKAGIYVVARFTPVFGGSSTWFWLVSLVGLMTLFWGAFSAIRQTDLKALLAYSTISQLGLVMSLFGVSSLSLHPSITINNMIYTQAAFAALFHLVNHSTFKGALFMVVGILDFQIGTRDIRRLGGLMVFMPISFTVALIGSFSMAGLPPFNGFLSKEMFFTAMLSLKDFDLFSLNSIGIIFPIVAWIASVFTFIYSMIIVFKTFSGKPKEKKLLEAKEAPLGMLIAPVTLALLIIAIFLFPNVLADNLLRPALFSIYPEITSDYLVPIKAWHGFNTELLMTFAIVIVGSILFGLYNRWRLIYKLFPKRLSFDSLYNQSLIFFDRLAKNITTFYMTGYLRNYFQYIFITFAFLIGFSLFKLDAFNFSLEGDAPIGIFEWTLAVTIIIAGGTIIFTSSRLTAIIINGYIGFTIAMFFVLFRAPDLALTQLVIETVTTALFLLALYFLPKWETKRAPKNERRRNLLIATAVGTIFTLVALSVKSGKLFTSISSYFEDSEEKAGAHNIVNTILGDFRAFDTMLEVIVLFIAGLGVFTLVKANQKEEVHKLEDK